MIYFDNIRDRQARSQTKYVRNNLVVLEKDIHKMKKTMVKHLDTLYVNNPVTSSPILPTPNHPTNFQTPPRRKRMKNDFLHRVSNFGKIVLDKLNII